MYLASTVWMYYLPLNQRPQIQSFQHWPVTQQSRRPKDFPNIIFEIYFNLGFLKTLDTIGNCKRLLFSLCVSQHTCTRFKTLDTIGNCQRAVFSLGVSQHMHKITYL